MSGDNNEFGRGTPRAGRGASLLEMMKLRQPGGSDSTSSAPCSSSVTETSSGRGRASLLELHRQGKKTSSQSGSSASQTGVSQGRASLLGFAKRITTPGSSQAGEQHAIPGPSGDGMGVTGRLSALSLAGVETVSVTESEPISHQGESGRSLDMTANYINIGVEPNRRMFEYEVKYSPDIDSRPLRSQLLNQHLAALGSIKTFDGAILCLPHKLQDRTTFQSEHPMDGSVVTLTVYFKKQRSLGESVQFFNILIGRIMRALSLVRIGRQNFNPKCAHPVPQHRLELWPGYITAIDEYEGGLKLCIDATHRVMRTETVRDLMHDIYRRNPHNFRNAVMAEVVGTSVLTRYNNKTYRIDDIYWDKNPLFEFEARDNTKMSLVQYYKSHWNLNIRDLEQPLLLHRARKRLTTGEVEEHVVLLIPEFCYLAGLTDSIRSDFRVMKDLASVTRVSPDDRRDVIRRFVQEVKKNKVTNDLLAGWGLRLEDDTLNLVGRVLEPEVIHFGKDEIFKGQANAEWSSAATKMPMLRTPNLNSWCIVFCQKDANRCSDFTEMLQKVSSRMGMKVTPPTVLPLKDDKTESYVKQLRQYINPNLELVVIVCPTNRNDRYAAVKKLCCAEMPIASQVIMTKTISRPDKLKSVTEKIALQINCKLGGALWALKIPLENCMICGIDVYHAGVGQGSRGSVAAFVASLDKSLTSWYNKICMQGPHQELIDLLKICLVSSISAYNKRNNRLPDRIIIYRDGVGDGQLDVVSRYEVKQFEMSFKLIDPSYKPKLSVVIVQKRINTRLFSKIRSRLENPPPGTIMDNTITRRNWYDFFLVSQNVRQGTVSPTHYIVICDGANMKTDYMQRLTYKLCHLYYNWPGTIRVPAPCQYAHKLAYLVGQSIQMEPDESLADKLFYL